MDEDCREPGLYRLENFLIVVRERNGHWQARAASIGVLSRLHASPSDAAGEIKQYLDDAAAGLAYQPPTSADAWYRVFAEKAGSPAIWEARLPLAEDLEAEAARLENGSGNLTAIVGNLTRSPRVSISADFSEELRGHDEDSD